MWILKREVVILGLNWLVEKGISLWPWLIPILVVYSGLQLIVKSYPYVSHADEIYVVQPAYELFLGISEDPRPSWKPNRESPYPPLATYVSLGALKLGSFLDQYLNPKEFRRNFIPNGHSFYSRFLPYFCLKATWVSLMALSVFLVYFLAAKLTDSIMFGLMAQLMCALNQQLYFWTLKKINVDTLGMTLTLCSLAIGFGSTFQMRRKLNCALAGGLLGLAGASKYTYFIFLPVFFWEIYKQNSQNRFLRMIQFLVLVIFGFLLVHWQLFQYDLNLKNSFSFVMNWYSTGTEFQGPHGIRAIQLIIYTWGTKILVLAIPGLVLSYFNPRTRLSFIVFPSILLIGITELFKFYTLRNILIVVFPFISILYAASMNEIQSFLLKYFPSTFISRNAFVLINFLVIFLCIGRGRDTLNLDVLADSRSKAVLLIDHFESELRKRIMVSPGIQRAIAPSLVKTAQTVLRDCSMIGFSDTGRGEIVYLLIFPDERNLLLDCSTNLLDIRLIKTMGFGESFDVRNIHNPVIQLMEIRKRDTLS